MKKFPLQGHRGILPPTDTNVRWITNEEPKGPCCCSSCVKDRRRASGNPIMYASSGPAAREFNRRLDVNTKAQVADHEARVARVLVITIEQTGCPMDISYELQGSWLRDYCVRHNCTYYARPRESFSEREAREQAVRENKNTVIVEDLS